MKKIKTRMQSQSFVGSLIVFMILMKLFGC